MLAETHVTEGSARGYEDLPGTTSYWAPGTAARAGVGIVIQNAFLHNFQLQSPDWLVLEPGRLAALRLSESLGRLDLVVGYLPTGTRRGLADDPATDEQFDLPLRQQRESIVKKLGLNVASSSASVLVAADWNFVTCRTDR